MKRRVYERLLYICCSQNWEAMGSHFWIKQCTEVGARPAAVCWFAGGPAHSVCLEEGFSLPQED